MIDKLMTSYQKIRKGLIGTFADIENISYIETSFYDLGYMQTQIKHIQKELKIIEDSLTNTIKNESDTDEINQYRNNLMKNREMLIFHMLFLMSNSFANLDNCRKLAKGHEFKFMSCVDGLDAYHKGDKKTAFELLENYFGEYGKVEEHFLVNKVFGLLLSEAGRDEKAIPFLSYALTFVPDDLECLNALSACYKATGQANRKRVIDNICEILGA